jgi:hypothetical protein
MVCGQCGGPHEDGNCAASANFLMGFLSDFCTEGPGMAAPAVRQLDAALVGDVGP